jgi:FkbM family methyltransferase
MNREFLKSILPKPLVQSILKLRNNYFNGFAQESYSQEGEDRILKRIFEGQKSGFYIDVGAHHPKRFSNTYLFYKMGWSGINIDAMPGSMKAFDIHRPRDINLEQAISSEDSELTYYCFNEPALNSFSKDLSRKRASRNNTDFIIDELTLKTQKLSQILNEYLPPNTVIDFLSIDVEGLDYDVIKSNDWVKYSPKLILIEILSKDISEILISKVHSFLSDLGYHLYSKCAQTAIYKKELR